MRRLKIKSALYCSSLYKQRHKKPREKARDENELWDLDMDQVKEKASETSNAGSSD
jgi:hypothetical protein